MNRTDEIIRTLKITNSQRQTIINRLAFECVNKGTEIRRLKRHVETLEKVLFNRVRHDLR